MPRLKLRPGGITEQPDVAVDLSSINNPNVREGKLMVKEGLRHTIWQETATPGVYSSSVIKTNNPGYYLDKVDRDGYRIFYKDTELDGLDPGWMSVEQATVAKYKCPYPGCRKTFPEKSVNGVHGLRLLQGHVMGFHKRDYQALYGEAIEKRIRAEVDISSDIDV